MIAWLLVLLAAALVLLALAYLAAPVIVAVTYRQRTNDLVFRIEDDDMGDPVPYAPSLQPRDVFVPMRGHLDSLAALGFTAQGWYAHVGVVARVYLFTAVATKPDERLVALVSTAVIPAGGQNRVHSQSIQIGCERADGYEIATTSSDALMPPGTLHGRFLVQVPPALLAQAPTDPLAENMPGELPDDVTGHLLAIQRRLLAHLAERAGAPVPLRPAPSPDELPEALRRSQLRQLEALVEADLLTPAGDGVTYRPTILGALVLAWSMIWPISTLRRRQRDLRTARLLARIGWPA
jgi:hypothetical protein